jgi:hypothetical protein
LGPTFGTPSAGTISQTITPTLTGSTVTGTWTGLSLASGQSVSITLSGFISGKLIGGTNTTLTDSATVSPPAGVTDPNSANNTASDTDAVLSPTTLSTTPTPATVTLGPTPVTLKDTANLAGFGFGPTGTITFTLIGPGGATVDTEMATVNGIGTYTTPNGFTPSTGTVTGTYQWDASYSGDTNNNASSENAEQVTVSPASPTLITFPNGTPVTLGPTPVTLNDTATLAGGFNPTGTITFTLDGPGGTSLFTDTENVVNGTSRSADFTLPSSSTAGVYQWVDTYSGDANNNGVTSSSPEPVVVLPTITITTGGTTNLVDPVIAGTVDPGDAIGSSVDVTVKNSSNAVIQQIQNIPVNAQGGFSSSLDLPTDGQYTAVANLTTSSNLTASSNAASYILNSTPNEPDFGTVSNGVFTPNNDAVEVARLYYGLLDRAPDPGGLAGWTNDLENGASLSQVTQGFLGSAEYQTTSIGQSDASFVQFLYNTALGRSPDASGFQGWDNALNTGTLSRADVVNGFLALTLPPRFNPD